MRINVPIRAASAAVSAAGLAIALLATPSLAGSAQAASNTTGGHTARAHATSATSAKLPLSASQLAADRRRQDGGQSTTSSLTGLARTAAGQPLSGICVTAYGSAGDRSAVTSGDGRFVISGLKPGRYRIEYRSCAGGTEQYLPEWYGDVLQRGDSRVVTVYGSTLAPIQALSPETLYPADSTLGDLPGLVVPQHGSDELASDPFGRLATTPASPASLMKSLAARYLPRTRQSAVTSQSGRITGVVSSPNGHGLRGICVEVVGVTQDIVVTTTRDGSYRTPRLPAGQYIMAFYPLCGNTGNWLFQIYKGIYNETTAPTLVKVRAGKATGISVVMKDGGEISGSVTGPGGRKLTGICVYPLTNANVLVFTAVSSKGVYHIHSLPPGAYQIGFASCGLSDWAPTLWPDTQSYHAAPYIQIRGTRLVGHVDEIMQPGGTVTGTVTAATNPPTALAGMCVIVSENAGLFDTGTAATSATGSYAIYGLDPGSYSVAFFPGCNNNGNYVGVLDSEPVNVFGGQTLSGVNGALPLGATISGKVTSAASGHSVSGICVTIYETLSGGLVLPFGFETSNSHGRYSVDQLPVGTYQIQFSGGCGNSGSYAPQGWSNSYVLDPQNLLVTQAGEVVQGIGAALQPGPIISGVVTNSSGRRLGGICVLVGTAGGVLFNIAQSGDGRYEVPDLAPGNYQVYFAPGCGNNADLAEVGFKSDVSGTPGTVSVISGTLNGVDAVMPEAGGISGVIRAANDYAVQLSCIFLTGVSGSAKSLFGEGLIFGRKYEFTGLPVGGYQVTFEPGCIGGALAAQWYKDKPSPAGATTVRISASHVDRQIDSLLHIGGSIAGRVTNDGKPVRNLCVYAQNIKQFADFGSATSNSAGDYDIHGLNSGLYEIEVEPCGPGSDSYAIEVLPQLVRVTAPHRTSGVKSTAVHAATISGTVLASDSSENPAGACVEAYETNGDSYNYASVGLDGKYSITNLPPGTYDVYFADPTCSYNEPGLAPQWYLGKASERDATPVTVSGVTNVNAVLADDGSISGSVTAAGNPLRGVCVAAIAPGSEPVYSVTSRAGSYAISGLPAGGYRVEFSSGCGASGYRTQWWRDKPARQSAMLVKVTAGTTTSGVSATLRK